MRRLQRQVLEDLRSYRGRNVTIREMMSRNRTNTLHLLLYMGSLGVGTYFLFGPLASSYVVVVAVSFLIRDMQHAQQWIQVWPVSEKIIDWGKVDQLLNRSQDAATTSPEA